MSEEQEGDRKSKAASPVLISDPEQRARKEAENGLAQFDAVMALVEQYREERREFRLRLSTISGTRRAGSVTAHRLRHRRFTATSAA